MKKWGILLCALCLSSCGLLGTHTPASSASTPEKVATRAEAAPPPTDNSAGQPVSLDDPFHSFNDTILTVNDKLDTWVAKPLAQAYVRFVPSAARSCIGNITSTLGDVNSAINAGLQGKMIDLINGVGRILFNTSVGVGGCFDVATANGQPAIPNDFGITLAIWGVPPGPYLMLPLFGPQTLRSTAGLLVDGFFSSALYAIPLPHHVTAASVSVRSVALINQRAQLLGFDNILNNLALNRYDFIKSAYWQNRRSVILRQMGINPADDVPDYSDPDEDPGSGAPNDDDPDGAQK